MKILSWNCRGLAQPSTIRSLRAMIRKSNLDIIFLSETKIDPTTACSILHQLGFVLLVQAPPSSSRRGLLLAWKSDVKLTSFYVYNDIISVWCYSDSPVTKWMISFVYVSPYQKNNLDLWSNLATFGEDYDVP
jgi:exonuclease III